MAEMFIGNIRGLKGDTGTGLTIKDFYSTPEELFESVPTPSVGDAYGVGEESPYDIYIYSASKGWVNSGSLQPDVNDQAPTYAEATTLESLTSGEKISIAFGKIKKAIKELVSHLANKSNPHGVTASQVGAVALKADIVVGKNDANNTTRGGIRFGIVYNEEGIPMVGMGTERGSNNLILTSGCDYVNEFNKEEISESDYYFPSEIAEHLQSYPVALKISYSDGKPYFLRSANGKKHYTKNEIIPMDVYELLHTGNLTTNKVARIEQQPYTGNGLYGFENARTFTFSFKPTMLYISGYGRGGGNYTLTVPYGFPFAHTVVHTSDGGFAAMNCEFQYSGNSITMYNTTSANNGFNTDGKPYTITAIG